MLQPFVDGIAACAERCAFEPENVLAAELAGLLFRRIVIEGGIGAGKSTMGRQLVECLRNVVRVPAEFLPEHFLPDMLAWFYKEMDLVEKGLKERNDAAFPMQLQMLHLRQRNYERALALTGASSDFVAPGGPCTVVEDRFVHGDAVFAALQRFSPDEWRVYLAQLAQFRYGPAYVVYLDVTAGEAYRRKKERNRDAEREVKQAYLHRVRLCYYLMLTALSRRSGARILLLRNDRWHDPLYVLRRIMRAPPASHARDLIFSKARPLGDSATEEQLDEAFEELHLLYDAYEAERPGGALLKMSK